MNASSAVTPPPPASRRQLIIRWALRLVAAAIMAIGALPKLTGQADALADVLPGGGPVVLAIGVAEAAALVLILVPRTAFLGTAFAALIMVGAVASHLVGPVPMDGDLGQMFPLAVIGLLTAAGAAAMEWRARGGKAI